jgi:hypothetical protein
VARTWPFEDQGEPEEPFRSPEDFVVRQKGVQAVVVRIGLNGSQLVLVDEDGRWERWVLGSNEEAEATARGLGLAVQVGAYPDDVRVRMNDRVRPKEDFARGAYPEQGRVGPVIPYRENRPRSVPEAEEEANPEFDRAHPGLAT